MRMWKRNDERTPTRATGDACVWRQATSVATCGLGTISDLLDAGIGGVVFGIVFGVRALLRMRLPAEEHARGYACEPQDRTSRRLHGGVRHASTDHRSTRADEFRSISRDGRLNVSPRAPFYER